ncbi:MAG: ABC transporter permease [Chloroflexota bacterium]
MTAVGGSTGPATGAGAAVAGAGPSAGRRLAGFVDRWLLRLFTIAAIGYLMVPILVMIVFSFNKPEGKFNFVWAQFSLDAWATPLNRPGLSDALWTSILVAIVGTFFATILGTLIALALVRYRFRGRNATNLFIFVPMATPEIVLGASLLTIFVSTATLEPFKSIIPSGIFYPLGLPTIIIAHIMFNISYVVVTVKARIQGFDRHLEEAAMDLGANEWTTFWKVTFPLIRPGIVAAALLAFSLSIDDFIVTNFTSGLVNTFPVWVWGTIRNNLPPQVHVIGTAIFLIAVGGVAFATWLQSRGGRTVAMRPR